MFNEMMGNKQRWCIEQSIMDVAVLYISDGALSACNAAANFSFKSSHTAVSMG